MAEGGKMKKLINAGLALLVSFATFVYMGGEVFAQTLVQNHIVAGFSCEISVTCNEHNASAKTEYFGTDTNYINVSVTAYYNTEKGMQSKEATSDSVRGALDVSASVSVDDYVFDHADSYHSIVIDNNNYDSWYLSVNP